jgi:hypothetical protein
MLGRYVAIALCWVVAPRLEQLGLAALVHCQAEMLMLHPLLRLPPYNRFLPDASALLQHLQNPASYVDFNAAMEASGPSSGAGAGAGAVAGGEGAGTVGGAAVGTDAVDGQLSPLPEFTFGSRDEEDADRGEGGDGAEGASFAPGRATRLPTLFLSFWTNDHPPPSCLCCARCHAV